MSKDDLVQATAVPTDPQCDQLHAAWRPIETAPKDGQVLFYCHQWSKRTIQVGDMRDGEPFTVGNVFVWDWGNPPTHWMHLPAPPQRSGDRPACPNDEEAA